MNDLSPQLKHTLKDFSVPDLGQFYSGKVRENYTIDDQLLIITTDRISAFDRVLGTIPFKGEILNRIAKFWFEKTTSIVPNHIISYPDPQVMLVKKAKTLPIEIIVRGYITGSLWREYSQGINGQYGFNLSKDLKKNQKFESPIITPTTKAEYGKHDEPISRAEIIKTKLVDESVYQKAEEYAMQLFEVGQNWAKKRGLILVDTKYEFGIVDDELIILDEIHTPDSSRYWVANQYAERFEHDEDQKMLDKENIRQWLLKKGFSGEGDAPALSDEIRIKLSERYIELFNQLTGLIYVPEIGDVKSRIISNLRSAGYKL